MTIPRVLIVDDDPNLLNVLGKLVQASGIHAETFASPSEMLGVISAEDYGCVLTDLEMPEMSGIDVHKRLIEMDSCLAVIVITGHADVQSVVEIMGLGAVTLLEKPFKSAQLLESITRAVAISEQKRARQLRHKKASTLIRRLDTDELDVLKLAAAGLPNKTISQRLDLSPRTVDRRRKSALSKLGVASVAEFAVMHATSEESL